MKRQLELKDIVGYFPYGLELLVYNGTDAEPYFDTLNSLRTFTDSVFPSKHTKPILYDISCLTEEIEVNDERFVPLEKLGFNNTDQVYKSFLFVINQKHIPLSEALKLYEWHIDIHALIPAGLAIDKKTLK